MTDGLLCYREDRGIPLPRGLIPGMDLMLQPLVRQNLLISNKKQQIYL